MSISEQISQFVSETMTASKRDLLSFNDFAGVELGAHANEDVSETYEVGDFVTVTGWNTNKNGVQDLIYATISGSLSDGIRIRFENETRTRLHTHNYIEFVYVAEGRLMQQIEGKTEIFQTFEICLLDSESEHLEYLMREDACVIFIGIDTALFEKFVHRDQSISETQFQMRQMIAKQKSTFSFVRFLPKNSCRNTERTITQISEEFLSSLPNKQVVIKALVERFLCLLTEEYTFTLTQKEKKVITKSVYLDIKNEIAKNPANSKVSALSKQYHYHPDYLNKLWKSQYGMSLSSYIQHARLNRAKHLLETSDSSVEQIAADAGYANLSFFYRKFKAEFGEMPASFRKS